METYSYTEKGFNTWKNDQNQEETRSFEFNFNAAGEMTAGPKHTLMAELLPLVQIGKSKVVMMFNSC